MTHLPGKFLPLGLHWTTILSQHRKELTAFINYNIREAHGLPPFITTGSCAEIYYKLLRSFMAKDVEQGLWLWKWTFEAITRNSHWPKGRIISGIFRNDQCLNKFPEFLQTYMCPSSVRADVKKAERNSNKMYFNNWGRFHSALQTIQTKPIGMHWADSP